MPDPTVYNYTLKTGTKIQTKFRIPEQYLDMVEDLRQLKSDGNNPNVMTESQKSALGNSLLSFGWTHPIITNTDGLLADGEQRHTVCMSHKEFFGPVLRLPFKDIDRRLYRQVANKLKGNHNLALDMAEYRIILQSQRLDKLASLISLDEEAVRKQLANREAPTDSLFKLLNPQYQDKPIGISGKVVPPEIIGNLDVAAKHTLTFVFESLEKRNQVRDVFLEGKKNHVPSGEELWQKLNT